MTSTFRASGERSPRLTRTPVRTCSASARVLTATGPMRRARTPGRSTPAPTRAPESHDVALAFSDAGAVVQRADGGFYNVLRRDGKSAKLKFDNSGWLAANAVAKAGYGSGTTYATRLCQRRRRDSVCLRRRRGYGRTSRIPAGSMRRAVGRQGRPCGRRGRRPPAMGQSFETHTARLRRRPGSATPSTPRSGRRLSPRRTVTMAAFADAYAVGADFIAGAYRIVGPVYELPPVASDADPRRRQRGLYRGPGQGDGGELTRSVIESSDFAQPRSRWRGRPVSSSAISTVR